MSLPLSPRVRSLIQQIRSHTGPFEIVPGEQFALAVDRKTIKVYLTDINDSFENQGYQTEDLDEHPTSTYFKYCLQAIILASNPTERNAIAAAIAANTDLNTVVIGSTDRSISSTDLSFFEQVIPKQSFLVTLIVKTYISLELATFLAATLNSNVEFDPPETARSFEAIQDISIAGTLAARFVSTTGNPIQHLSITDIDGSPGFSPEAARVFSNCLPETTLQTLKLRFRFVPDRLKLILKGLENASIQNIHLHHKISGTNRALTLDSNLCDSIASMVRHSHKSMCALHISGMRYSPDISNHFDSNNRTSLESALHYSSLLDWTVGSSFSQNDKCRLEGILEKKILLERQKSLLLSTMPFPYINTDVPRSLWPNVIEHFESSPQFLFPLLRQTDKWFPPNEYHDSKKDHRRRRTAPLLGTYAGITRITRKRTRSGQIF